MSMTKKALTKRLLDAGLSEDDFKERVGKLTAKQLKELPEDFDLPVALKELGLDDEFEVIDEKEEDDDDKDTVTMSVKKLKSLLKEVVVEVLNGAELEAPEINVEGLEVQVKELDTLKADITEIKEIVGEVADSVEALAAADEERLKELMADMPRGAKQRIRIKRRRDKEDDDEEDLDEDGNPIPKGKKKKAEKEENWFEQKEEKAVISDGEGNQAENMTDFIRHKDRA